ncbi:MAG: L-serine ammonia-lyase, iron-sulfur-dependent subunit beta [Treponema sp.]|jgi:L-serine dehydratase|nr:L-serine ammonia-lyase, iron-sulfur-dependent subunit beta [Treponema sp.]
MSIFDIVGPVMVGPSSSHTAGAVRIGLMARRLLKEAPVYAEVGFYGSFAATYRGHGTDRAITAGLLGMQPDDDSIPNSLTIAAQQNLKITFSTIELTDAHPNTAVISLKGLTGRKITVQASSIGGGRIMINKIDGIEVNFNGEMPALIVHNYDEPGHVSLVTGLLYTNHINIAAMQLYRNERGGYAVMVVETDQCIPPSIVTNIEQFPGVIKVTYVNGGTDNGI